MFNLVLVCPGYPITINLSSYVFSCNLQIQKLQLTEIKNLPKVIDKKKNWSYEMGLGLRED